MPAGGRSRPAAWRAIAEAPFMYVQHHREHDVMKVCTCLQVAGAGLPWKHF